MKLTGLKPLLLLYFFHTETYFENAVNNGSFSKHGVTWQSILKGPWGYWAITLQCLFTAQLMSSVAQQQRFTASLTGLYFPSNSLTFGWWVVMQSRYSLVNSRWIGLLVKPLLYKYKMASAPTQKHLSEGLSEGGVEDFWYNEHLYTYAIFMSEQRSILIAYCYFLNTESKTPFFSFR